MANANMGIPAIRQQVASAVDLFIQLARLSDGSRRVTQITECVGMEGDFVTTQDVFVFNRRGIRADRRVIGEFRPTGVRPKFDERLQACGIRLSPGLFETIVEVNV